MMQVLYLVISLHTDSVETFIGLAVQLLYSIPLFKAFADSYETRLLHACNVVARFSQGCCKVATS